jgi:hypothetical protein
MDFAQATKRVLMQMIPLLPLAVYMTGLVKSEGFFLEVSFSMIVAVATGLLTIIFLVNFIATTSKHALPWHDRWARTEAVLVDAVTNSEA